MFKKGELVYRIHAWDSLGTFFVQPCIVHACGQKRMVLYSLDKTECVGNQFQPREEQRGLGVVVRCADRAEAEARALTLARAWIPNQIVEAEQALERTKVQGYSSDGYVQTVNKRIAALKTAQPAVVWR